MSSLKKIRDNPLLLFESLGHRELLNWIPDKLYLSILYRIRMHKRINWETPESFNEKLQWLKLNDRKPIYTSLVDKYEAKLIIGKEIGEEYIIPTLGVWDSFDQIDFSSLPSQFVLKCTHDSGGLVIVRDKDKLDYNYTKRKIEICLKHSFYWGQREWPYKNVKPRIIAEKYMAESKTDNDYGLIDYKFFCFNGLVKFIYVSQGLENHDTASISFLTMDWKFADFSRSDFKPFRRLPQKPSKFDEMVSIAERISKGHDFLRVDLYEIQGRIYFSEVTFYPCGGFLPFMPDSADNNVGKLLTLSRKT